jgi:glutathione S-transferase
MLTLHYAPRTRAVRIRWLFEELGLPHQLRRVPFVPPSAVFSQSTPSGKFPVLEDGEVVIAESGAILEYVLERYGDGRLAPPIGSPARGAFLQWVHFAESTAYPPLGNIIWFTFYRQDADALPAVIEDARERAHGGLAVVERALLDKDYLLGRAFSGADVMMGFTIAAATLLGLVSDDRYPNIAAYFRRLEARPAYQRATAD